MPLSRLSLIACALLAAVGSSHANTSITLAWDPSTQSDIAGYRLHAGTYPGVYTQTHEAGRNTAMTVSALEAGKTYYFAVTAYNTSYAESQPSNEVAYATGGSSPTPVPTGTPTPTPTGTPSTPTTQSVTSLTLINADTDQVIRTMVNGETIDYASLGTNRFNIVAQTNPASVGSVRFGYDGNPAYSVETEAPYALAGNSGANYQPWTPSLGTHTITATPYSGAGGSGTAGTPHTISFTVTNGTGATPAPTATPTPYPTATPFPTPFPTPLPTATPAAFQVSYLGMGMDRVGTGASLSPDGVNDHGLALVGLRGSITKISVREGASNCWESPYNGTNWNILQIPTQGGVEIFFAHSAMTTHRLDVTVFYTDGVSQTAAVQIPYTPNPSPTAELMSATVQGPDSVSMNTSAQFTASAFFSDGSTLNGPPTRWSTSKFSISSAGVLSAGSVRRDTAIRITASVTLGGKTVQSSKTVVIKKVAVTKRGKKGPRG